MRTTAYVVALVAAFAFGCSEHRPSDEKESLLSAARAANEQIQMVIAEVKCGDLEAPQGLCAHLKQAQADVDNTIYRINGGHK
ncbi:hypothetical protein [Caballeronia fortuita]|uniref:hypothetical protein n=1 Tax=Caballeronia fortuita TaxID=1777138 RepID=UPI000772B9F7|nr:hypothetical protein [Caballeronia fortuita]